MWEDNIDHGRWNYGPALGVGAVAEPGFLILGTGAILHHVSMRKDPGNVSWECLVDVNIFYF